MSDADTVRNWLESGHLVRPSADVPNFVDLVRALAALTGVQGMPQTAGSEALAGEIGEAEHHVLVLADGLGDSLLELAPEGGFLRSHRTRKLQSVFPSTTASAMVTLATAEWPAAHGATGWWVHLEDFGLTATALRFVERFSERRLGSFGIRPQDLWPVASFWPRMTARTAVVIGADLAHSAFTDYQVGGCAQLGYDSPDEAERLVGERIRETDGPAFTYVYLPHVDAVCHRSGVAGEELPGVLAGLDLRLERLASALPDGVRLVVTSDHGEVDVPWQRNVVLELDEPLLDALVCPPAGEPVVPVFHVRPGREGEFAELAAERFGGIFSLITPDEAEDLHLLGPGPLTDVTRRRLGTFIGIAGEPAALYTRNADGTVDSHVAVHAGLTADEMWSPLILA
jgi:hypothetical protein